MNKNEAIIKYIQSQVKKGFYPTHDGINEKFHTNIEGSIKKLYKLAGVEYKRDPNPFLRYEKEKRLADMTKKLFLKLNYKIKNISIGPSRPSGADIILEDQRKRLIPAEIKAFQKFGKIGQAENSPYIRNEFLQFKKYIKNLRALYGYLVTSTDRKTFNNSPLNIKILFGKDLKKLLLQFKMYKELKDLDWIRNSSISYGKEEIYRDTQNKILKFVKKELKRGKYVPNDEIIQKFKVHIESYFPGGMKEIYQKLNVDLDSISNSRMGGNVNKKLFRRKVITFIKNEVKKKKYPTYKEIQKKFQFLPTLFFQGGIREMYKEAGIKYNRKFASKTPKEKELIRQKIIQYTKKKLREGRYPRYRDFRKDLLLGPLNYFNSVGEIYRRAGCNDSAKKTWKNY